MHNQESNYPIVSDMTPTAGGVVFFGDVGGNFYALDAANGQKLWGHHLGGALGGGVITYTVNGAQKKLPWRPASRAPSGRSRS